MIHAEGRQLNDTHVTRRRKLFSNVSVSVLLAFSVVVNVALAHKVSTLNKLVSALYSTGKLHSGDRVPIVMGYSVDGHLQTLKYDEVGVPTVLYIFTPQCGWCKKNLENLHALINNSGNTYRIVGISLTTVDLQTYLDKEHLAFPVYRDISEATKAAFKIGGTPSTIVVSPGATVLKAWNGAYQDPVLTEIEQFLKIRLPGCCSESLPEKPR